MKRCKLALSICLVAWGGLACDSGSMSGLRQASTSEAEHDGARPQAPPRVPEEALAACERLDSGATCQVTLPARTLEGSCHRGPDGQGLLLCAPSRPFGPGSCGGPPQGPPPGPPPAEVLAACDGLSDGAACSVILAARTLEGTCRQGPDGQGPLFCAPPQSMGHMPSGPSPMGPPPAEALTACESLNGGASCSVTLPARTLEGSCRQGPDGQGPLLCAPSRPFGPGFCGGPPQGPPPGPPPAEVLAACDSLSDGATCSATLPARTLEGSCRQGPDGQGPLFCVPAPPPQR